MSTASAMNPNAVHPLLNGYHDQASNRFESLAAVAAAAMAHIPSSPSSASDSIITTIPQKSSSSASVPHPVSAKSVTKGERRYPCGYPGCKWVFTRSNHVLRHHQRVHPGFSNSGQTGSNNSTSSNAVNLSSSSPDQISSSVIPSASALSSLNHNNNNMINPSSNSSKNTNSSINMVKCDVANCDQEFKTVNLLNRHKKSHHNMMTSTTVNNNNPKNGCIKTESGNLHHSNSSSNFLSGGSSLLALSKSSINHPPPHHHHIHPSSNLPQVSMMHPVSSNNSSTSPSSSSAPLDLIVPKPFSCTFGNCGKSFTRKDHLKRHVVQSHIQNNQQQNHKMSFNSSPPPSLLMPSYHEGMTSNDHNHQLLMYQHSGSQLSPGSASRGSTPMINLEPEVLLEVDENQVWVNPALNNASSPIPNQKKSFTATPSTAPSSMSSIPKATIDLIQAYQRLSGANHLDNEAIESLLLHLTRGQNSQQLALLGLLSGNNGSNNSREEEDDEEMMERDSPTPESPNQTVSSSMGSPNSLLLTPQNILGLGQNHFKRIKNVRPYVCDVRGCNKSYTKHSHLVRHKVETHKIPKPEPKLRGQGSSVIPPPPLNLSDRPYVCDFPGCRWSFKRQYHLDRHFLTHRMPLSSTSIDSNGMPLDLSNGSFEDEDDSQDLDQPLTIDTSVENGHLDDDFHHQSMGTSILSPTPSPQIKAKKASSPQVNNNSKVTSILAKLAQHHHQQKSDDHKPMFQCYFPTCGLKFESQHSLDLHTLYSHTSLVQNGASAASILGIPPKTVSSSSPSAPSVNNNNHNHNRVSTPNVQNHSMRGPKKINSTHQSSILSHQRSSSSLIQRPNHAVIVPTSASSGAIVPLDVQKRFHNSGSSDEDHPDGQNEEDDLTSQYLLSLKNILMAQKAMLESKIVAEFSAVKNDSVGGMNHHHNQKVDTSESGSGHEDMMDDVHNSSFAPNLVNSKTNNKQSEYSFGHECRSNCNPLDDQQKKCSFRVTSRVVIRNLAATAN